MMRYQYNSPSQILFPVVTDPVMKNHSFTLSCFGAILLLIGPAHAQLPEIFQKDNKIKVQQSPDQTKSQVKFFQGSHKKIRPLKGIAYVKEIQDSLSAYPHIDTQDRNNFWKIYQDARANEGSVDPGIFYAPAEIATPAAKILKPLTEVDPKMVFAPDNR